MGKSIERKAVYEKKSNAINRRALDELLNKNGVKSYLDTDVIYSDNSQKLIIEVYIDSSVNS